VEESFHVSFPLGRMSKHRSRNLTAAPRREAALDRLIGAARPSLAGQRAPETGWERAA
jgi:hypothetical protein